MDEQYINSQNGEESQKSENNSEVAPAHGSKDDSQTDSMTAKAISGKFILAVDLLKQAEGLLVQARELIQTTASLPSDKFSRVVDSTDVSLELDGGDDSSVIEGVFDGQKMIGPDGKHYSVPANYASKSKLVEGDLLKLTITSKGAFVYKQIGPNARRRLRGTLMRSPVGNDYSVKAGERTYRVLTASVTYFRGRDGDETIILVPENGESKWAAVENIMKSSDHIRTSTFGSDDGSNHDLSLDLQGPKKDLELTGIS